MQVKVRPIISSGRASAGLQLLQVGKCNADWELPPRMWLSYGFIKRQFHFLFQLLPIEVTWFNLKSGCRMCSCHQRYIGRSLSPWISCGNASQRSCISLQAPGSNVAILWRYVTSPRPVFVYVLNIFSVKYLLHSHRSFNFVRTRFFLFLERRFGVIVMTCSLQPCWPSLSVLGTFCISYDLTHIIFQCTRILTWMYRP